MREDDIAALRQRSGHSLEWANRFLDMGEYIKSIRDGYDAAFYAAKAALIHLSVRSKSHRSVYNEVSGLVDKGVLPPGTQKNFRHLFDKRNEAAYRYARGEWTEEEASKLLESARLFVGEMRQLLELPEGSLGG